ncbi:MAG TPA: RNB domain-containing ribonuclease, partial [Acidobacteriota bacterium]|nr:RNB domain-containing ribonuclease [Acidobacteriota bacterium]
MKRKRHSDINDDERILRYLSSHQSHSFSARDLARKVDVKKHEFKPFRRTLRKLTQKGILLEIEEGIYQWPSGQKAPRAGKGARTPLAAEVRDRYPSKARRSVDRGPEVEGTIQQYRGGFAFLIRKDKQNEDIFVPPGAMGGAMDGDRVVVRVVRPEGQRKAEGQVVRILERRTPNLVGVFRMGASRGRVIPWDHKIQIEPVVSTKNFNGATDGMMVEAEIFSDGEPPEARIVSLLGFQGEPDLDIKIIISKYGLGREFPPEVLEEAGKVAVIREADYAGRKDFRDWFTVTIDGEKARDFDDAISVTAFKNGSFLLGVHIADVAHYVKEGTPLDAEGLERGNSVYFPDVVIPMLPEKLSNEMCSLNPQVDRLTMSVVAKIEKDGAVSEYHIYPSVINSNERMTYTAVKSIVEDHDPELLRRYEPLIDMFFTMKKVALLLMEHRRERGSIDFDLPEPEVIIDITTGK